MEPKHHDRIHHSPAFVPLLTYTNPDHGCPSVLILSSRARPSVPSFGKPQGKRFPWGFPKPFLSFLLFTLSNICLGLILRLCFHVRLPFASGLLHGCFGAKFCYSFYLYLKTHSRLPCFNISDFLIIIIIMNVRLKNEVRLEWGKEWTLVMGVRIGRPCLCAFYVAYLPASTSSKESKHQESKWHLVNMVEDTHIGKESVRQTDGGEPVFIL